MGCKDENMNNAGGRAKQQDVAVFCFAKTRSPAFNAKLCSRRRRGLNIGVSACKTKDDGYLCLIHIQVNDYSTLCAFDT